MEGLNTQALKGFSLKCRSVSKEKSNYICNTDQGLKAVRKVFASSDTVCFQHRVKEILYSNGFANIDRFMLSSSGKPYYMLDNDMYVVTDYIQHRETRLNEPAELKATIAAIARMHNIWKNASRNEFGICFYVGKKENSDEVWQKHCKELRGYKKLVSRQSRMSDFDVLFLKNYDYMLASLTEWYSIAVSKNYKNVIAEGFDNSYICHNLLKEETLLTDPNNSIFITNFSECGVSHYICDLSAFIKRYMKLMPENMIQLEAFLESYEKFNPLSVDEKKALYAQLLFPDKFIKICAKYYVKKRTWIPAAFMTRMENIYENREKQRAYIDQCSYTQ